jgi:hypothetical protein
MRRAGVIFSGILISLVILAMTGWGALALYYSDLPDGVRALTAVVFAVLGVAVLAWYFFAQRSWHPLALFVIVFALLLVYWSTIEPRQDRDWAPEYQRLAYAAINGDQVTVHNIRNFDYRTETDFTPRYYDKTFDLNKLDSVDVIASYWAGDAIAHIIVSFGFAATDFLAVSIETRRERNENYSSLAGFFKQYELFYVVADERDLLRLRTNYRKEPPEEVYLYRVWPSPSANRRRFFLDYLREINALAKKPEFYNTLTTNCTTAVLTHSRVNPGDHSLSWKILLSGYVPQLLYERQLVNTSLPFDELRNARVSTRRRWPRKRRRTSRNGSGPGYHCRNDFRLPVSLFQRTALDKSEMSDAAAIYRLAQQNQETPPAEKVSHCFRLPLSMPRRNHCTRCAALPWVKASGTT